MLSCVEAGRGHVDSVGVHAYPTGEPAFMDASDSGDEVFFLTSSAVRLTLNVNRPGANRACVRFAPDVYDDHVCRSAWPCIARLRTQAPAEARTRAVEGPSD